MQTTVVNDVVIAWHEIKGKKYLRFVFKGAFSEAEADLAIQKWRGMLSQNKGDEVDLIWNCLEMTKYTGKAAKMWSSALGDLNQNADTIWVVTTNTFIKMGAKTVTFLLPINLKVVSSEDQIQ